MIELLNKKDVNLNLDTKRVRWTQEICSFSDLEEIQPQVSAICNFELGPITYTALWFPVEKHWLVYAFAINQYAQMALKHEIDRVYKVTAKKTDVETYECIGKVVDTNFIKWYKEPKVWDDIFKRV